MFYDIGFGNFLAMTPKHRQQRKNKLTTTSNSKTYEHQGDNQECKGNL